tara:strand:- start:278 stop:472 length:195 start_codon:yes stop_codon:yes gene_type:complete
MTPTVGKPNGVNQIGYGPINPRNVIGDDIYETDSPHFVRAKYDASTSFDYTIYYKPIPDDDIPA